MASALRILVRGPNWIGDHILASGFFSDLRREFPRATISLACPEEIAPLASPDHFDEVLALSRAQRKLPWAVGFWRGEIRSRRFDLAITLPTSVSAAWLLRLAGIPRRIGYADRNASLFLTRAEPWKGRASGKHKATLYRELLRLVTDQPVSGTPSRREAPTRRESSSPTIVLAPGASIELREWPGFVDLARELRRVFPDCRIRVVGSSAQSRWDHRMKILADDGVESWIGMTTLPELVELCREARFVVANDSGVGHVAATLAGTPTVVVFGPGDPAYVLPVGDRVRTARASGVACSPCESAHCHGRFGYQKCLKDLSVEQVLREIHSLVARA